LKTETHKFTTYANTIKSVAKRSNSDCLLKPLLPKTNEGKLYYA